MSGEICVVITTVANADQARSLARAMIEARVAACAQIMPMASIYRWDGKVVEDSEQMILFKTMAASYEELQAKILSLHPYDTPEIIQLPVSAGFHKYLAWVAAETRNA